MIIFLHQGSHSYTHNSLIGKDGMVEMQCRNYTWLLSQEKLPKATYIFIDRERMDLWELRVFSAFFKHIQEAGSGYRAINNPAKMMNRRSLLRALHVEGINDFNAYSLTEKLSPAKFPVFIRREHDHGLPLTDLLHTKQELEEALESLRQNGEPDDGVLIIEYCAEPLSGTFFRKLAAYRIGEQTFFYNCVHEHNWLVKYGTKNSANDTLYKEEQKMIRENAFEEVISKVFNIANIDYGRVDFGLVKGKVQIYEINTNPTTTTPQEHPNPIRVKNQELAWERYCKALSDIDTTDPDGPYASKFKHPELIVPEKTKGTLKKPRTLIQGLFCSDKPDPFVRR